MDFLVPFLDFLLLLVLLPVKLSSRNFRRISVCFSRPTTWSGCEVLNEALASANLDKSGLYKLCLGEEFSWNN